jgi:hypothetical protein
MGSIDHLPFSKSFEAHLTSRNLLCLPPLLLAHFEFRSAVKMLKSKKLLELSD